MTRDLIILTKTSARRYILGKNTKPLTLVRNRLYRTDERFFIKSRTEADEIILYDVDETQPRGTTEYADPDETMAYIDIAKSNKRENVSRLDSLNSIKPGTLMALLVVGLVVFSLLTGGV